MTEPWQLSDQVGDFWVSTVELVEFADDFCTWTGRGIFETMVFDERNGDSDVLNARDFAPNQTQARINHEAAIKRAQDAMLIRNEEE